MKYINVRLDEKTVKVSKLPAKKYVDVLKQLRSLPKKLQEGDDFSSMTNEKFIALLPDIIEKCWPEVMIILSEATDVSVSELEELGIHELIELVIGVVEVNKYLEVYQRIKKFTAQPTKPEVIVN